MKGWLPAMTRLRYKSAAMFYFTCKGLLDGSTDSDLQTSIGRQSGRF